MRASILSFALILTVSFLSGAELTVLDCDSDISFTVTGAATATDIAGVTNGAKRISLPAGGAGEVRADIANGTQWGSYQALQFWVKSDSGATWGTIQLLWGRHYADFPITNTWTEVTIPWRNFTQRLYGGPVEGSLGSMDAICFTVSPGETHDGILRPAMTYDVDEMRVVDGLSLSATPIPSSVSLPKGKARVAAAQPLKVVCLGTSITYGHINGGGRVGVPWPSALETKLKAALGKGDITVMNYGVRGAKTWQGACSLEDFVYAEAPDIVIIEYMANDRVDAELDGGVNEYIDNMNRLVDMLLRWDQADVVVLKPTPYGQAGNTHLYDSYMNALAAAVSVKNLLMPDVNGHFLGMSEAAMLALYLDPADDHAHLNEAGLDVEAQVICDVLVPHLEVTPGLDITVTVPASATENDGVLGTQGTVTLGSAASGNQTVNLSSNTGIVSVPPTVTVSDGQTTVNFNITVGDDDIYTGTRNVIITASASGWSSGTDMISIADDDIPVTISLPASVQEGDGLLADAGMVSVPAPVGPNLTVYLDSDDTGELQLPSSVVIIGGSSSALFDLSVINDGITDSNVIVTVTASASGYADGTDTVTVFDFDYVPPDTSGEGTKGGCLPGPSHPAALIMLILLVLGTGLRFRRK
ncbi:SGNH/GDSL hydrolase family protein [Planctomycetota bacterium]